MIIISSFQNKKLQIKYGTEPKRILKRQQNQREKILVLFWITWALIRAVIKALKGNKEDISHEIGFLNEYKQDDGKRRW